MKTRSQTKKVNFTIDKNEEFQKAIPQDTLSDLISLYEVNIDFDEASEAWLVNKKRQSNATYKYICLGQTKTGRSCNKKPLQNSNYCSCHIK
jgi:hypothetical protein